MYNDKLIKQFGKEMNIEGDSFYAVKQQYIKWLENKVESAMCEANSVVRSFTHNEVKNIILEYENIILYSQSHNLNRAELRSEFRNIRNKYKLLA